MIARAMDRGVSSADIGAALNLQVESVLRRFRLLEGISPEAAEMLKDTPCSMKVFDILCPFHSGMRFLMNYATKGDELPPPKRRTLRNITRTRSFIKRRAGASVNAYIGDETGLSQCGCSPQAKG